MVDAALCDLVRGEMELRWRNWEAAQRLLESAARILDKNYPDKAARIQYGLARIARALAEHIASDPTVLRDLLMQSDM